MFAGKQTTKSVTQLRGRGVLQRPELASLGVAHYTALDSISYHLKEGERADRPGEADDGVTPALPAELAGTPIAPYPTTQALTRVTDSMSPAKRHDELMIRISSDKERQAREGRAASISAEEAAGLRLEAQAQRLRRGVQRVVGPRHTDAVLRAIHSVSWTTRPLRHRLARMNRAR